MHFLNFNLRINYFLSFVYLLAILLNCVSAEIPKPKPDLTKVVKAGDWTATQDFLEINRDSVNSINDSGGRAIHEAAFLGDAKQTKLLIKFKADVNAKDKLGMTPLHIVSSKGYTDCLKILLDAGALPNETDNKGKLPIHYAVSGS
ncbi:ankyrin repeat domain-containing protein [Leptospira kanakyensis]|uniref:ankyrin repeat domain-containing protein n=1 Tax=Leptospira kanakyensis TaxID=2484968 RepID=UPI00223E17FD|nr:ankyrin repeat domain-containing protein [Leptospira kanakyensis]MCW7471565.1 ankyrin repeat domain-containing protein [Leptospira kanakyensis]